MTLASRPEAIVAMTQRHLDAYCAVSSPEYELPAHVALAIEHLEALERGDIQKLMMFWPPQHGKSSLVSQRFPAWYLGRHPRGRVVLGSYGQELASRNGRLVRNLLTAPTWPFETGISFDSRAVNRWNTTASGGLIAVGVGTGLTGQPGDLMSLDDPIKGRLEADSPIVRENTWAWYTDVWQTRRSPQALELFTETRWHDDDPAGRILNSDDAGSWTVLELPALARDDEPDPLGRQPGEALWPERYDAAWLAAVRRTMSPRSWDAMYQQRPVPEAGNIIRREWLQHWETLPPDRLGADGKPVRTPWRVVITIDSAWDEGVGHDPSAIATWGSDGGQFFLLDYWAATVQFPDLRAAVLDRFTASRWRPSYVFVEDAANGRPLVQELRRTRLADNSLLPVVPVRPVGSKIARLEATTQLWMSHQVFLPQGREWLSAFTSELLGFPYQPHDEAVDTTSVALLQLAPYLAQSVGLELVLSGQQQPAATPAQARLRALEQRAEERRRTPFAATLTTGPRRISG